MERTEEFDIDDVANEYGLDTICVYNWRGKRRSALVGFHDIAEANEIAEKYGMEFWTAMYHPYFGHFKIEQYKGRQMSSALYRDDDDLMTDYENCDLRYILREKPSAEKMLDMIREVIEELDGYIDGNVDADTIHEILNNADEVLKETKKFPEGHALLLSSTLRIIDDVETDNLFEYINEDRCEVKLVLIKEG